MSSELYREQIIDLYENPLNYGELDPHDREWLDHNPLCGDELGVHLVVDEDGTIGDLTIRSFGIVRPGEMPEVRVTIAPEDGEPVCGSDAVFAAVALAVWRRQGLAPSWPTGQRL